MRAYPLAPKLPPRPHTRLENQLDWAQFGFASRHRMLEVMNLIGRSSPLGATVVDGGVNFSLFSRSAAAVDLLFFDRDEDATPSRVVRLDPVTNRTYYYWHVFVPGVPPGQIY